jgi:predicted ATPase/DNA-binding winged helix-turn-helix (wHTH) protein
VAPAVRLVGETGAWEVNLATRELRANGVAVPIGSRAFEIVGMLAKAAGEVVTKDDFMQHVWSGIVVEDNTIQVHISAIRKALGPDRGMLKTVPGRGYCLLGNWTIRQGNTPSKPDSLERADAAAPHSFLTNVPVAASALVGRETAVLHLCDLVSAYRAVTLTGPGGIGKTVLASEVARRLFPKTESDIFFVELAPLSAPELVASTVASVLGLRLGGDGISPESVARAIGNKKLLLVLDNCEHVIDAAARLVETLVRQCPRTSVLATSRELLRIQGESVFHVAPLEVPSPEQEASGDVLEHNAVQLFIARMRSLQADFVARGENLPAIAAICRRLDGIPLAIELAVARAATLGIAEVAGRLDDRFRLLTGGRRTLPRHQTLRATLDWSYSLLPAEERVVFRRLAVFAGVFDLAAACAIVASPEITSPQVIEHLSALVAKSLVVAESDGTVVRYRLLDTPRSYAREKLDESGEREELARRHAAYHLDLLERAEPEWESRRAELVSEFRGYVDDVRTAMDWAFSPVGDGLLGVALAAAAVPLWIYLSFTVEQCVRAEQALAALTAAGGVDARREMKLQVALARARRSSGVAMPDVEPALARALHLAESLGDVDHQLRTLATLHDFTGDRETKDALAQKFFAVASTPADRMYGEFMVGVAAYWFGDLNTARHHLERVIAHGIISGRSVIRAAEQVLARTYLASVLWLQGFPQKAIDLAKDATKAARAADRAATLCRALARAECPIALWVGNLDLAEYCIDLLIDEATRYGLTIRRSFGDAYRGMLLVRRGDLRAGLPLLRGSFDELEKLGATTVAYRVFMFLGELAAALGRAGQLSEGLAAIDDAIERSGRAEELWIMPELLRIKGDLLVLHGAPGAADEAEACFRKALGWAERQNALSWQLRAATSLARLLQDRGRPVDALAGLAPVYDRFTEGFETADLTAARALLDTLRP